MHVRDGIQTHATVARRYRHLVDTGAVEANPAQQRVAEALDRLIAELAEKRLGRKSSALGWLLARNRKPEPVRGLYIHGGVGAGKTMLMDMFHDLVPVRRKRRVHFNDFMADVHDRIQRHRQARKDGTVREDDPIPPVARALAEQAWVLCFDEFSVTDIADAMILSRLFSALFAEGVVLVATSNVAPDDLYRDGLNRQLFLPFVDILKRNAEVMALDAGKDYRMEKLARLPVYITPAGAAADARMDETWDAMTRGSVPKPAEIEMKGRAVLLRRSVRGSARGARLPGHRGALRHDLRRPHPAPGARTAQPDQAADPAGRRAVRQARPSRRQRRHAAAAALCRPAEDHGSVRIRAHRVAPDRDAGQGLAGRLA